MTSLVPMTMLTTVLAAALGSSCSTTAGGSAGGAFGDASPAGDADPGVVDASGVADASSDADLTSDAAGAGTDGSVTGAPGTWLRMDFAAATTDLYAAPWPSEHLRDGDRIDLSAFPRPDEDGLIDRLVGLVAEQADGFPTTAPIHFAATAPLDPATLPGLHETVTPTSPVYLVGVDADAPDRGLRYPVDVYYQPDGGPFGAPNLLAVSPLQGLPLRPGVRYAAVVLRELRDASGDRLGVPDDLARAVQGLRPEGLSDAAWKEIEAGLGELEALGVDLTELAGFAIFRTGWPQADLSRWFEHAVAQPLPLPPTLHAEEVFDDYCVLEGTLEAPIYQQGTPPFLEGGGGWVTDAEGEPAAQGTETARVVVTIPRRATPASGFPTLVFIRTGGGGDRPLVDRGVRSAPGGPAVEPGSGPARDLAREGWAGISVDGPHGGLRNVMGGDEQLLMFNIDNPLALRDNIRQSALELALLPEVIAAWVVDTSSCPGADGEAHLDAGRLALMGHSMGATIAPLVLAVQPGYRAVVLSGAGGSWIENVLHKQSPLEVRPVAELILGYHLLGRTLAAGDPALTLLQWAGEPADPPIYGRAVTLEPAAGEARRHVLMLQGIVDTYILPPIANATSLSLGLDLAGPSLDAAHPALAERYRSLAQLLPLAGTETRTLPAAGNLDGATAIVTQHPEDGVEDGHEVAFQTEAPKRLYRCFLAALARGETPVVVAGAADEPCP